MHELVRRVTRALMQAQAGGFLATPPDFEGNAGLGIPGISGIARPRRWDAVASADAPALTGDTVHFYALADGSIVVDEDEPDGSLTPLAAAVEETLRPPYRAEGLRRDGSVWTVSAVAVIVFELEPEVPGERVELTRYEGERQLTIDGETVDAADFPELDGLAPPGSDFTLRAEHVEGAWWAVTIDLL